MNAVLKLPTRKPSRAKATATSGSQPALLRSGHQPFVDPVQRREMITAAAYFNAEHRGFAPGHELDDWLAAENQVDATLTLDLIRSEYGEP